MTFCGFLSTTVQTRVNSCLISSSHLIRCILKRFNRCAQCFQWMKNYLINRSEEQRNECPTDHDQYNFPHSVLLFGLRQSFFNFLIGLVLPKGVDRPNDSWNPADQRELHHQTEKACERTTNREEGQPWQQKRNQKSHG
jgi:hypothetical protein